MHENVLPGMAQNAWNEGVTLALRFGAGGPAFGMPGFGTPFAMLEFRDATPLVTEVFRNSQMPRMDSFTPAYVDPGRAKFLEIQKMEWEYKPPSATKLPFKGDFDWFKPTTPVETIVVRPAADIYNIKPFEPIKLVTEDIRNPFFGEKRGTDFGIQPIKIGADVLPSGGMHDSFNVTRSGDIFNGHTTIELKGGLKQRLGW